MPIDASLVKWDAPDPAAVQWDDAPAEQSFPQKLGRAVLNAGAGALRGAGSIGATLLAPRDAAESFIARKMGAPQLQVPDRREAMTGALSNMGADTDSLAFGAGKIGTEIAGTLGVGGAAANTLARVPGLAAAAPGFLQATRTAGMSAGGATGLSGLGLRAVGGAVTGAASAGLVNPEDAGMGALIGGAAPVGASMAGWAGNKIGGALRGPAQTPEMVSAISEARNAGYVIPPTQAKPTLGNRILEGLSGKLTTAQNASAKNQAVTNKLAAQAVGLPVDQPITADALKAVRQTAGQAYDAIGQSGVVTAGPAYVQKLDDIAAPFLKAKQAFPNAPDSPVLSLVESLRSPQFDAAAAVEKIKMLRTAADDAFRTGNTDIARASKTAAGALEDAIESHLQTIGQPDLLTQFRDARKLIAKTYTVEKALNPASGSVDARKLGAQIKAGKPLSGDLRAAGDFALRFPKAAQAVEGMGSLPQTSPLDWAMGGGLAMGTGNPLMMASMLARPAARSAILSPMVQNRLIQRPGMGLLSNPDATELLYRGLPVGLLGAQ